METPFALNSLPLRQRARWRVRSQVSRRKTCKASALYTIGIHAFFINLRNPIPLQIHESPPFATPDAKSCFCFPTQTVVGLLFRDKFKSSCRETWRVILVSVSWHILYRITAHPRGAFISVGDLTPTETNLLLLTTWRGGSLLDWDKTRWIRWKKRHLCLFSFF